MFWLFFRYCFVSKPYNFMSENKNEANTSRVIPLIAGGTSGFVTRFLTHPLDVIKIRFQVNLFLGVLLR